MEYQELISKAEEMYSVNPDHISFIQPSNIFSSGGYWMKRKMNSITPESERPETSKDFNCYGYIKYGISLLISALVLLLLWNLTPIAFSLSVLTFYIIEVHFVFLFPIVIEGRKDPFLKGSKMVYQIGFFKCLFLTIRIASYMIYGLFNLKNPTSKWYIGCLAIVIWYLDEVRVRS